MPDESAETPEPLSVELDKTTAWLVRNVAAEAGMSVPDWIRKALRAHAVWVAAERSEVRRRQFDQDFPEWAEEQARRMFGEEEHA